MTAAGKITVKFYGGLSQRDVQGDITQVDADGSTVQSLISSLRFEDHEVGTVLINGKPALRNAAVHAGDDVALFKPLG